MSEQGKPCGSEDWLVSLPALGTGQVAWVEGGAAAPGADVRGQAQRQADFGDALWSQGRFDEALESYCEASRMQPEQAEYHRKVAIAAWATKRPDVAASHFEEAVRLDPENAKTHEAISRWYCEAGEYDRALFHSGRALELSPDDAGMAVSRGEVLQGSGQSEAAWQLVEPLVAGGMVSAQLGAVYGRLAPAVKREREALAYIERLLQSPGLSGGQTAQLEFVAATLLDRLGQYDEAFWLVRRAKESSRLPYDSQQVSGWIDREIKYFSAAKLRQLPRARHGSRRPVFIVGMPRSGTSLVEQILASHPEVYGAGELRTLSGIVSTMPRAKWTRDTMYPESLDMASVADMDSLAGAYLSVITSLNGTATYVTDKNPMNFLDLGLIAVLFPGCHVIHCTRDPLDTCLSCYMTLFGAGAGLDSFAQDLPSLAAFYRDYERQMRHWKTITSLSMLEVNYEEVVKNIEGQTRGLLDFLDLPWAERCLWFYENKRRVSTPSGEQVRRPVYTSSIGRWRRYEKHLSELVRALGR